jgi:hypothetical protein
MHPSYMGPRMPRPCRERLTSIPGDKLDVALGIYHRELSAIVERQNSSRRAVNTGGRPKCPSGDFASRANRLAGGMA